MLRGVPLSARGRRAQTFSAPRSKRTKPMRASPTVTCKKGLNLCPCGGRSPGRAGLLIAERAGPGRPILWQWRIPQLNKITLLCAAHQFSALCGMRKSVSSAQAYSGIPYFVRRPTAGCYLAGALQAFPAKLIHKAIRRLATLRLAPRTAARRSTFGSGATSRSIGQPLVPRI